MQAEQQMRGRELEAAARQVDAAVAAGDDPLNAADALTGGDYDASTTILAKRDAMRRRAA